MGKTKSTGSSKKGGRRRRTASIDQAAIAR
jgi:hypothetical protein